MSLRVRNILNWVDIVLRVPPLFLIDELLRLGLGLPQTSTTPDSNYAPTDSSNYSENLLANVSNVPVLNNGSNTNGADIDAEFFGVLLLIALKFTASVLGCIAAICVLLLWTKHLVIVYLYLASVGIVFVSYWSNVWTVRHVTSSATPDVYLLEDILGLNLTRLLNPSSVAFLVLQNYLFQCLLAVVFTYIHIGPRHPLLQKLLPLSFMAPSLLAILPLPQYVLQHSSVFAALLPLALVKFVLWYSTVSVVQTIFQGYQYARRIVTNFGLSQLFEAEWSRLNVPCVLRTFWLLRASEHAAGLLLENFPNNFDYNYFMDISKSLLITGCETLTALLGMTSIVSFMCHYIGCFFQWVLLTEDEDDKSIGTVSAILFYVLALQTGLTSIEPEKRFLRLGRNFFLLFTALLHFIYNIVNPLLMSLSASHNPSVHRHARALLVCAFLILFPTSLLYYLWSNHQISTWLLAVSAFSIEVIVKVLVSLMIYLLFLIDAYRSTFWERLDDYVYYIRAFGNTVEFCFGIFLFFNGGWILMFESGGAIRAVMMCIHAYFNIWCEAKAGWSVFMKRRTAVNKINSLPEATDEQLEQLDDVCAICYQEMQTAKITSCNHYFHGVCLRKWLYVQDRCPLCHDILYKVEGMKENAVQPTNQEDAPENNEADQR